MHIIIYTQIDFRINTGFEAIFCLFEYILYDFKDKKGAEIIDAIQQAPDFAEIKKQIRKAQRYTVNVRGCQLKRMEGLIQPITEKIPNLYMIASTGSYCEDCGITEEWEPLIY